MLGTDNTISRLKQNPNLLTLQSSRFFDAEKNERQIAVGTFIDMMKRIGYGEDVSRLHWHVFLGRVDTGSEVVEWRCATRKAYVQLVKVNPRPYDFRSCAVHLPECEIWMKRKLKKCKARKEQPPAPPNDHEMRLTMDGEMKPINRWDERPTINIQHPRQGRKRKTEASYKVSPEMCPYNCTYRAWTIFFFSLGFLALQDSR